MAGNKDGDDVLDRLNIIDDAEYESEVNLPNEEDEDDESSSEDDTGSDASDDDSDGQLQLPLSNERQPDKPADKSTKGKTDANVGPDGKPLVKEAITRTPNGLFTNAKGDIVDPRDGVVIARAGSERRLFEKNMRMARDASEKDTRIEELTRQNKDIQFLNNVPQQYGLDTADVQHALALAAVFKKNPVEAARNLVELALQQGHNVSDILGKDAGDALEMRAVKQMLDERLAPLTQQRTQQSEADAQKATAQRAMESFIDEHEHSDLHLPVLDRMIGDNPQLTPEKAYYELRLFCANKGLDFTKPLAPQIAALQQNGRSAQNGNRQPTRNGSLPNGRGTTQQHRPMDDAEQYDPRQSWDDIIRSLNRKAQ